MGKYKLVLFALLFSCSLCWSQTIVGKIYTRVEAENIYGPVNTSVPIHTNTLNSLINNTTVYIMFRIFDGNLIILGDYRKPLFPAGVLVNPQDEMRLFSVFLVKKLIVDGNSPITYIELRTNNVLTVTNGIYTLEYSLPCPPVCTD